MRKNVAMTGRIELRVSAEEKEAVQAYAEKHEKKVSDVIRDLIERYIIEEDVKNA